MKGKTPLQIFHEIKDTYADNGPMCFCYPVLGKKIQIWLPKCPVSKTMCDQADPLTQ